MNELQISTRWKEDESLLIKWKQSMLEFKKSRTQRGSRYEKGAHKEAG